MCSQACFIIAVCLHLLSGPVGVSSESWRYGAGGGGGGVMSATMTGRGCATCRSEQYLKVLHIDSLLAGITHTLHKGIFYY